MTYTDITNEVQWRIRLLQSTKEQIGLNNAGANALFGFSNILLSLWEKSCS